MAGYRLAGLGSRPLGGLNEPLLGTLASGPVSQQITRTAQRMEIAMPSEASAQNSNLLTYLSFPSAEDGTNTPSIGDRMYHSHYK